MNVSPRREENLALSLELWLSGEALELLLLLTFDLCRVWFLSAGSGCVLSVGF